MAKQQINSQQLPQGDTGWITPALNATYFHVYSSSDSAKIRRVGKVVMLQGAIQPTAALVSAGAGDIFAAPLDAQFRPSAAPSGRIVGVMQGSGTANWALSVYPTGEVLFERWSGGTLATSTWLPFNITWLVD